MRVIICAPVCLTLVFVMQDKGLVDQTRGILNWVTENCPDNFHQEIGYATVIPTELDAALQLAVATCSVTLQFPQHYLQYQRNQCADSPMNGITAVVVRKLSWLWCTDSNALRI